MQFKSRNNAVSWELLGWLEEEIYMKKDEHGMWDILTAATTCSTCHKRNNRICNRVVAIALRWSRSHKLEPIRAHQYSGQPLSGSLHGNPFSQLNQTRLQLLNDTPRMPWPKERCSILFSWANLGALNQFLLLFFSALHFLLGHRPLACLILI